MLRGFIRQLRCCKNLDRAAKSSRARLGLHRLGGHLQRPCLGEVASDEAGRVHEHAARDLGGLRQFLLSKWSQSDKKSTFKIECSW